jgi:hypothetical protein
MKLRTFLLLLIIVFSAIILTSIGDFFVDNKEEFKVEGEITK